ncbi:MAG: lytic transglycosylase domain-containing protein [Faecalibacterium sp.]|jgi:soluble lytic murein transglycosylase-like protein|nr:lytic transglycosylase domain-containing protein [Faecalibacterium sp.]
MQHSQDARHARAAHEAPHVAENRPEGRRYADDFVESARGEKARPGKTKKAAASPAGEWDLGPRHVIRWDKAKPLFRVLFASLFVLAVCFFWPTRPENTAVVSGADSYQLRPVKLEAYADPQLAAATPRPSVQNPDIAANSAAIQQKLDAAASAVAASISAEEEKELKAAENSDNKETVYSSAEDYFGSDDVFLTFYDIMEDVVGPVPTTPIVDGSDKPASGTGGTTGGSAVISGSGGAACVVAYNNWDNSLKQYAYNTAQAYGISYEMVLSIIYHESRFNAGATHLNTNGTTDWGLMQINDVCFSLLQSQLGISGMSDLLDPYKAIQAGCAILAYHLRYTGNENDALLRYQVGNGAYNYYKANGTTPASYNNTLALRDQFVAAGI